MADVEKPKFNGGDFVLAFLFPMLIGKSAILYFGVNYSNNPGEGYGFAFAASIVFTVLMACRLLWKYRNYED